MISQCVIADQHSIPLLDQFILLLTVIPE